MSRVTSEKWLKKKKAKSKGKQVEETHEIWDKIVSKRMVQILILETYASLYPVYILLLLKTKTVQ